MNYITKKLGMLYLDSNVIIIKSDKNQGNYWPDNYGKKTLVMLNQLLEIRRENWLTNTKDINKFENFYKQLYKSEVNSGLGDYETFFSKIKLSEMSVDQKKQLDRPIRVEEVKRAISSVKTGKIAWIRWFSLRIF